MAGFLASVAVRAACKASRGGVSAVSSPGAGARFAHVCAFWNEESGWKRSTSQNDCLQLLILYVILSGLLEKNTSRFGKEVHLA